MLPHIITHIKRKTTWDNKVKVFSLSFTSFSHVLCIITTWNKSVIIT